MRYAAKHLGTLLLGACVAFAVMPVVGGSEPVGARDDAEASVETAFWSALEAPAGSGEQRALLERVAKEGPESVWADDALWMLGQMAYSDGDFRHAVYYWQYLLALHPEVMLTDETKSLDVYMTSGLPQIEFYLRATAKKYVRTQSAAVRDGQRYLGARPVNAAVMLVWERLGESYERFERPRLALRAYRNARAICPSEGAWHDRYDAAVRRLEEDLGVASGRGPLPSPQPLTGARVGAAPEPREPAEADAAGEAGNR